MVMERFDVRRGKVKQIEEEGGLSALAGSFFDNIEAGKDGSFSGSHGIMTSISGRFEGNALIVDVTNVAPNFEDPDAMKAAMDDRKRWTAFLDEATGYNSKQRGDKPRSGRRRPRKPNPPFPQRDISWQCQNPWVKIRRIRRKS